jgi:hypothetical protein
MTRSFVYSCVLSALFTCPLAAQRLADCSQSAPTDVRDAPAGDDQPVSKPSGTKTAQPEIPFPPSFDFGWLGSLFRLGTTSPRKHEWSHSIPSAQKR